ncbi:MAG: hypothetical protein N0C88_03735 [Candidatus Thiodiazotropha lotti]|uniref:Uncharacterized protein n=1 Tax=Candidatus Thiodiazotropha lotti TaxID=2792787 RepID=A0A9E4MYQ7_9GAMM|nr:hypothetical protein [Candidatus Thiodiazotropha lotti]MCG7937951.1 hypothetical protein [Candidatus Thiodiazotropha lotti]MCW4202419.1 hypothetical protein [Candidatus Thiodiazotropha lotti]MCW4222589.1 hypothetical protein [Candidatus Thiodiazotropha lotti]
MNNVIALNTPSQPRTDDTLNLPFIGRDQDGSYFWNPQQSDDPVNNYNNDYAIGRHYGELLLDRLLNRKDKLTVLGTILVSIYDLEEWDGFEGGFLEAVASFALAGHAVKSVLG